MNCRNEFHFEKIFEEHYEMVYAGFFKKTKVHETAQDLTQLTFIKVWNYRESFDPSIPVRVQVLRKAKFIYIDWLRQEAYLRERQQELTANQLQSIIEINVDLKDQLDYAIEQLPDVRKKVFTLSYLEGYSTKDIASELNISPRTVENHLYRAVKALRKILMLLAIFHQIQ